MSKIGGTTVNTKSDTPETDAYDGYWATKSIDGKTIFQHAQQLERERNELRADRDSWQQQASERVADWDAMRIRAEDAEKRVAELELLFTEMNEQRQALIVEKFEREAKGESAGFPGTIPMLANH